MSQTYKICKMYECGNVVYRADIGNYKYCKEHLCTHKQEGLLCYNRRLSYYNTCYFHNFEYVKSKDELHVDDKYMFRTHIKKVEIPSFAPTLLDNILDMVAITSYVGLCTIGYVSMYI